MSDKVLVLSPAWIALASLAEIAEQYPNTDIVVSQPVPIDHLNVGLGGYGAVGTREQRRMGRRPAKYVRKGLRP